MLMSWTSQMNYFLLLTIYLIEWHKFFADYILDRWFCMVAVWIDELCGTLHNEGAIHCCDFIELI